MVQTAIWVLLAFSRKNGYSTDNTEAGKWLHIYG